uniref:Uncharacterized protein n=1 Tax=Onchocerca flexuosa TaxID=387005 RepID=A0A183HHK3_9BILA
MSRFAPLLNTVSTAQLPIEEQQAQLTLIEQIIQDEVNIYQSIKCKKNNPSHSLKTATNQGKLINYTYLFLRSIIIEWPKILHEKCPGDDNSLFDTEMDFAPLIHRARNVVKCRTSHPTMRVRVCAIAEPKSDKSYPRVIEAFFRATLVKLSGDPGERQTAGRLILTQREGTSATKYHDQHGVVVNTNGKLLVHQASSECIADVLSEQYGENVKRTDFKYEHGTLCAIFPELVCRNTIYSLLVLSIRSSDVENQQNIFLKFVFLLSSLLLPFSLIQFKKFQLLQFRYDKGTFFGVTLNSMIDRRQLSTRYAIQMDVALNIENKLIVKHLQFCNEERRKDEEMLEEQV